MTIDIIIAAAVCAWLSLPVVLALIFDRPDRPDRRRRCAGVRFVDR